MEKSIFIIFILAVLYNGVHCERTKDKMYIPINGFHCFRRMNGTHTTGCSSPTASGSTGVIHFVESKEDLDFLLSSPPAPPYTPVIPSNLFTRENILRLKNDPHGYIASIVLIDGNKTDHYSGELKCPNQYSNFNPQACSVDSETHSWNPLGNGLLHEDFNFPMLYLRDKNEVQKLRTCFDKFNSIQSQKENAALCSMQISAFMSAAVDSEVCMRRTNYLNNLSPRRYCDPLQGKNVFASVYPRETLNSKKYIIISSRIDTTSMFSDIGMGAMDSLISFSALVNVAHLLTKLLRDVVEDHNVIFMVFNGEAYDYIGSQRFVYDLKTGTRRKGLSGITLNNIELLVDLGWIDDLSNMTLYSKNDFEHGENIKNYINDVSDKKNFGIKVLSSPIENAPPTSIQSFLRENRTFPAVVLSSQLKNKFYHSVYDDQKNIHFVYKNTTKDFTQLANSTESEFDPNSIQIKIRNISTALAFSVYRIITKSEPLSSEMIANPVLSDELLFCYLNASDCPLFKAASYHTPFIGGKQPPLRYISVQGSPTQEATSWAYFILGYLTGKIENAHKENCTGSPLYWFTGFDGKGECRSTTHNFSDALSPAFLEDNYDWKSGKYSTWTESTWQELSARIYLKPPHNQDFTSLAIGTGVTMFFIVITIFSNARSNVLFNNILNIV